MTNLMADTPEPDKAETAAAQTAPAPDASPAPAEAVDDGPAFTPARIAIIVFLLGLMVYQVRLIMVNLKSPRMPSQTQVVGPPPPTGGPGGTYPGGPPNGPAGGPGNGGPPSAGGPPSGPNPGPNGGPPQPNVAGNPGAPNLAPPQPGAPGPGGPQAGGGIDAMPLPSFYGAIMALSQDKATALTPEQSQKIVEVVKATKHPATSNSTSLTGYMLSILNSGQIEWLAQNKDGRLPDGTAPDPSKGDPTLVAAIATLGRIADTEPDSVALLDEIPQAAAPAAMITPEDLGHGLLSADKMPASLALNRDQATKLMAALRTLNAQRAADIQEKTGILKVLTDAQKTALAKLGAAPGGAAPGAARPASQEELLNQLAH